MERTTVCRVFLGREVLAALVVVLGVYFLPPLVTGTQLLYDSAAAPVWQFAVATGGAVGCGSMSCIPLMLSFFTVYTYVVAVVVGVFFRRASAVLR